MIDDSQFSSYFTEIEETINNLSKNLIEIKNSDQLIHKIVTESEGDPDLGELTTEITDNHIGYNEAEKEKIKNLLLISDLLTTIDCDWGTGNIEIKGENITIRTATHGKPDPLKRLLQEFNWESINTDYDQGSDLLKFTLEISLQKLV